MVVKRGDRYHDVLAVDRNGSTVTVRDEEGKIGLYSPKELITGDVQLFRRSAPPLVRLHALQACQVDMARVQPRTRD